MLKKQEETIRRFDEYSQTTYYTNLSESYDISSFSCGIEEYDIFLKRDALNYKSIGISNTYLLIQKDVEEIIGYFSLSMAGLRLSCSEKELHGLSDIPFNQFPCLRLGKLAISKKYKRMSYGAFIIEIVRGIAIELSEQRAACRMILVDADVQYDAGNRDFYKCCGFIENQQSKGSSIIGMHTDIYKIESETEADEQIV